MVSAIAVARPFLSAGGSANFAPAWSTRYAFDGKNRARSRGLP
jgi:hypothetical protein